MLQEETPLWNYLSPSERIFAKDGQFIWEDSLIHRDQEPTDYSYLVFPYAKLYEGFLKDAFFDLNIITKRDYFSNHYRIGRALSPNLIRRLGAHSAYRRIEEQFGQALADLLWRAWKQGRNLVFHYFPHDFHMLSRDQAKHAIELLVQAMKELVEHSNVRRANSLKA